MSTHRQELRARIAQLRQQRTGESGRKVAELANSVGGGTTPDAMLQSAGVTDKSARAAISEAALRGDKETMTRLLSTTLLDAESGGSGGGGAAAAESGGGGAAAAEEPDTDDDEAPPPLTSTLPRDVEFTPRCQQQPQRKAGGRKKTARRRR
jgi:hypothetical protein